MDSTFKPRVLLVNGKPMTTSLAIAGHFEKEHKNVIQGIRKAIDDYLDDPEFVKENFIESVHIDARGRKQPTFRLTELAFTLVAMGFTGSKAAKWKRAYAETFQAMREHISLVLRTENQAKDKRIADLETWVAKTKQYKTRFVVDRRRISSAEAMLWLSLVTSSSQAAVLWLLVSLGAVQKPVFISVQQVMMLLSQAVPTVAKARNAFAKLIQREMILRAKVPQRKDVNAYKVNLPKVLEAIAQQAGAWHTNMFDRTDIYADARRDKPGTLAEIMQRFEVLSGKKPADVFNDIAGTLRLVPSISGAEKSQLAPDFHTGSYGVTLSADTTAEDWQTRIELIPIPDIQKALESVGRDLFGFSLSTQNYMEFKKLH